MQTSKVIEMDVNAVDAMLYELISLQKEVKPINQRIDAIKQWCKEAGSFSTMNYVCAVKEQERRAMVSIEKAKDLIGMEFLEHSGLIYVSRYHIVVVEEKSDL